MTEGAEKLPFEGDSSEGQAVIMGQSRAEALGVAIDLVKHDKLLEARRLLRSVLAQTPHDEVSWLWFAATYPSDAMRLRILLFYLEQHPESEVVQKAVVALRRREQKRTESLLSDTTSVHAQTLVPAVPDVGEQSSEQIAGQAALKTSTPQPSSRSQVYPARAVQVETSPEREVPLVVSQPVNRRRSGVEDTGEGRLVLWAVMIILITVAVAVLWSILR